MLIIDKARELIENKECDCRGNSRKCYYVSIDGREYALLVYKCNNKEKNDLRLNTISYLCNQGLATPGIIGIDYRDGIAYELQEKCNGKVMSYRGFERAGGKENYFDNLLHTLKILDNADPNIFLNLINNTRLLHVNGYLLDCHPDNFMIDNFGNISFIDLDIYHKPKMESDRLYNYVNVLPWIFSFFMLDSNNKHYKEILSKLKSIGYKWFYQCVNYLSSFNLTNEEIINIVSNISFDYFMIDQTERNNMISSCFNNDISRKNSRN